MIIVEAEFYKLNAFRFSGITRLALSFTAVIQIILGTNGSGKSSLLRELTMLPAQRPDYEPDGYKRVTAHHHGAVFVATSDFSKKSSPHSFTKDGVELNEGGTSGVQEDLVRLHLGYTELIEQIITGQHKFSKMAPGLRKTLLMTVSPYQLGFVLEHHKAVSAAIRNAKANLTRLYERKAELEGKFMDASLVAQLRGEAETLHRQIEAAVRFAAQVDEALRQLGDAAHLDPALVRDSAAASRRRALAIRRRAVAFTTVPRHGLQAHQETLRGQVAELSATVEAVTGQLRTVTDELSRYQAALAAMDAASHVGALDSAIAALQTELAALADQRIADPFAASFMPDLPQVLRGLQLSLRQFLDCPVRLLGYSHIQRKQRHVQHGEYRLAALRRERRGVDERLAQLAQGARLSLTDVPVDKCAQYGCPLFLRFKASHDAVAAERAQLAAQQRWLSHRLARLEGYLTQQAAQLQQLEAYTPHLIRLHQLLNEYSYVKTVIRDVDILRTLKQNPLSIYEKVLWHYQRSVATHRHQAASDELATKLAEHARATAPDASERGFLAQLVAERQAQHITLTARLTLVETELSAVRQHERLAAEYSAALTALGQEDAHLTALEAQAVRAHEHHVYRQLAQLLDEARREAVSRLGQIERTLKDQDLLQARYDEEVVQQIACLEAERAELAQLEEALSPNTGIPHEYAVEFLNTVIEAMNFYIAKVFAYPFALLPVSKTAAVDYRFAATVGDVHVPEISTCSEAQCEIVDLTFALALILHLNLADYPIYLDESGRSFDSHHKQRLLELLRHITDDRLVSQMFLVNHHAEVHDGLANPEVLVLSDANILTPAVYNTHAVLDRH